MKLFLFILFSTFCVGLLSGAYAYFISHNTTPVFDFREDEFTTGFEIIADAYGGCSSLGCASYRISDSGAYDLIILKRNAEDVRYEGSLSGRALSDLERALGATSLSAVASSQFSGTCPITYDGTAYKYEIRVGTERFFLDSCENDLEGEQLFDLLEEYFNEENAL